MRIYKRGLIYIISKAFHELYPEALLTVNYQLYHSMLCEVENMEITEKMIEKVKERAKKIIEEDLPITKKFMTKDEAKEFYKKERVLTVSQKSFVRLLHSIITTIRQYSTFYNGFFFGIPARPPIFVHLRAATADAKRMFSRSSMPSRYPARKAPWNTSPAPVVSTTSTGYAG